jgi:hypothetical protein
MVVACVLGFAAAPLVMAAPVATYQADALVVARVLVEDTAILPRLAGAVFTAGELEARVTADPAVAGTGGELIPDRLSLVAAEDSVVLVVQGRDPDPATAARLANLGAAALVEELNRGGAGVGEFALQTPAAVPTSPLTTTDPPVRAALGGLAGMVLGLALTALIAAVRRPVVTAQDVRDAVGAPLLGRLRLTRMAPGPYPERLGARGIVTVARWVARAPAGRVLLISPDSAVALRQRVFVMVAMALQRLRPVRLEAAAELVEAARGPARDQPGPRPAPRPGTGSGELVLVDGGATVEIVDPVTTSLTVVAVAPRGISRRRLRALVADFMSGELLGVLLVEGRPGIRPIEPHPAPVTATAGGARQPVLAAPTQEAT